MSKRKSKNRIPDPEPTELGKQYYELWMSLQRAKEEVDIDQIRVDMTTLWKTMNPDDKKCFHTLSSSKKS